jgi:hypothetical protein
MQILVGTRMIVACKKVYSAVVANDLAAIIAIYDLHALNIIVRSFSVTTALACFGERPPFFFAPALDFDASNSCLSCLCLRVTVRHQRRLHMVHHYLQQCTTTHNDASLC